jgi:hypothetical protein
MQPDPTAHARASRLCFGGLAAGEAAHAEALGRSLSCPISLAVSRVAFAERYCPNTGRWSRMPDMPEARCYAGLVAI